MKRHPQWILAVDTSYCRDVMRFAQGFNPVPMKYFENGFVELGTPGGNTTDLASSLMLRERHALEKNKNALQILNYIVLKQNQMVPAVNREGGFCSSKRENFYSTYYRKKGVGEDRLADKMSIGWGGHSDRAMMTWTQLDSLDFLTSAKNNIIIELGQECRFRFNGTDAEYNVSELVMKHCAFKGFIYDMSDDVGQHHLALVWEVDVPDSISIESREDEHKLGPMCNLPELLTQKRERGDLYENWSNIVIDAISQEWWSKIEGEAAAQADWINAANKEGERQAGEAEPAIDFVPEQPSKERLGLAITDVDHELHQEVLAFLGAFNKQAFAAGVTASMARSVAAQLLNAPNAKDIIKLPMTAFKFAKDGTLAIELTAPIIFNSPEINVTGEIQTAGAVESLDDLRESIGPKA